MRHFSTKLTVLILTFALLLTGCSGGGSSSSSTNTPDGSSDSPYSNTEIIFADVGWDSIKLHSAVAGFIAVEAFGYKGWSEITGSSTIIHEGVLSNEVEVHMENWVDNLPFYYDDLNAGKMQEFGVNFDDNNQGLYVPRFVIEGDPERGIEALAPDLRTVKDLANYAHVFPDDENPGKGRIYGAIPGWIIDDIMHSKYQLYGLDEMYEYFRPGSDAAMNASISAAYEKGEPIVAYYWEPTWLMGKYDFVLLEDEPYTNEEDYIAGKTECPSVKVTITTSNQFAEANPEFCAFLEKYQTTSAMISEALAYMQDENANHEAAAKWFLTKNDSLLDNWLTPEQAQLVRDAL